MGHSLSISLLSYGILDRTIRLQTFAALYPNLAADFDEVQELNQPEMEISCDDIVIIAWSYNFGGNTIIIYFILSSPLSSYYIIMVHFSQLNALYWWYS